MPQNPPHPAPPLDLERAARRGLDFALVQVGNYGPDAVAADSVLLAWLLATQVFTTTPGVALSVDEAVPAVLALIAGADAASRVRFAVGGMFGPKGLARRLQGLHLGIVQEDDRLAEAIIDLRTVLAQRQRWLSQLAAEDPVDKRA